MGRKSTAGKEGGGTRHLASGFGPHREEESQRPLQAGGSPCAQLSGLGTLPFLGPLSSVLTAGLHMGSQRSQGGAGSEPGPRPSAREQVPPLEAAQGLGGREAAAAFESPGVITTLSTVSPAFARSG